MTQGDQGRDRAHQLPSCQPPPAVGGTRSWPASGGAVDQAREQVQSQFRLDLCPLGPTGTD